MAPIVLDVDAMEFLSRARTPAQKLEASVEFCRRARIKVRPGVPHAVRRSSVGWILDRQERSSVSILSAVCLAFQPLGDIVEPSAGYALGSDGPFACGVQDGFDNTFRPSVAMAGRHYFSGLDHGYEARCRETRRCDACFGRHLRDEACQEA